MHLESGCKELKGDYWRLSSGTFGASFNPVLVKFVFRLKRVFVQVLGRVSSLDTGGDGGTPCVGVECSHERCSNMTSMYKVRTPNPDYIFQIEKII